MHRRTLLGLLGVLGIWLTAGLALPFVNAPVFQNAFSEERLMVFRGFGTALLALVWVVLFERPRSLIRYYDEDAGVVRFLNGYTALIALTLPFATLGLFNGIRNWGASPTIIVITATPVVNIVIGFFIGRRLPCAAVLGLAAVFGGVAVALWGGEFVLVGFAWAAFGTLMNGFLYEWFARGKGTLMKMCFWAMVGMGVLGLVLSWGESWQGILSPHLSVLVSQWIFVGGFLYWVANLLAFQKLPTTEASVLAQGETPAVIMGAYILLGESLTVSQWGGVVAALFGAGTLAYWLARQSAEEPKAEAL